MAWVQGKASKGRTASSAHGHALQHRAGRYAHGMTPAQTYSACMMPGCRPPGPQSPVGLTQTMSPLLRVFPPAQSSATRPPGALPRHARLFELIGLQYNDMERVMHCTELATVRSRGQELGCQAGRRAEAARRVRPPRKDREGSQITIKGAACSVGVLSPPFSPHRLTCRGFATRRPGHHKP